MSRNRSRGRRGRRPGQGEGDAQQENQPQAAETARESAQASPSGTPAQGTVEPPRSPQAPGRPQSGSGGGRLDPRQRSRPQQEAGDRGGRPERIERAGNQERGDRTTTRRQADGRPQGGGTDAAGRQRRRQPRRRPSPIPMASEVVLKESVPIPVPVRPMAMRKIEELGDGDHLNLGCPMLTRTKLALHASEGLRAGRCSLGWAVHGEDEVVLCLHTPNLLDCWKVHPERIAGIQEELEKETVAAD